MQEATRAKLKRFGYAVRVSRRELGVSQEGFAELVGCNRTYVGEIENAQVNVSFDLIFKIARALKVTVAELMARAKI